LVSIDCFLRKEFFVKFFVGGLLEVAKVNELKGCGSEI